MLAFSRDFRTFQGGEVGQAAADTFPKAQPHNFQIKAPAPLLESPFPDVSWVRMHFGFDTTVGPCSGIARLVYERGEWKAYTLYTLLEEVAGHPQQVGRNRPRGQHNAAEPHDERRAREAEFADSDPDVLVVGAGHNGLACAAVLRSFGVNALVVDRFSRVGDNWRKRYASLSLHDPVWTDHMPLMPYPPNWPVWMQAGKLANWLEAYAEAQECNVWLESTVDPSRTVWLPEEGKWQVTVLRGPQRTPRTMKVGHVVMATGLGGGKPKLPPKVPGQDAWEGTIVHSSAHAGGRQWARKRALVVGACTSGHDISVDLSHCGADTTMLQRSPTFIMTIKNGLPLLDGGLFTEEVLETLSMDNADRIADSLPKQVGKLFHQRIVDHLAEADKEILDGLKKAGFRTWKGPEGTGWLFREFCIINDLADGQLLMSAPVDTTSPQARTAALRRSSRATSKCARERLHPSALGRRSCSRTARKMSTTSSCSPRATPGSRTAHARYWETRLPVKWEKYGVSTMSSR